MVIADSGEDSILFCRESGYAANVEKATSKLPEAPAGGEPRPMQKIATPDVKTVAQLEAFFPGWVAGRMAKTVLYHVTWKNKSKVVAVMMRGDLDVNEVKLANALDALTVRLATEDEIKAATGADVGFAGPVGLPETCRCSPTSRCRAAPTCWSAATRPATTASTSTSAATAACRRSRNCARARRRRLPDQRQAARAGARHRGRPHLQARHQVHNIAPFQVAIIPLNAHKSDAVRVLSEQLTAQLEDAGFEVLLDDRDKKTSAGVKFADMELMGMPHRIVVSERGIEQNVLEYKSRRAQDNEMVPADEIVAFLKSRIRRD
jgi:prolyl-tRNA synthetase